MSDERNAETPSGVDVTITDEEKQRLAEQAEFRTRAAQIVSRSSVQEALKVDIPADWHGEWIFNNTDSIAEAQFKGFIFYQPKEDEVKLIDHSKADGHLHRGDTVFMVIPKWKYDILDEEKQRRIDAVHGTRGNRNTQEEERAYLNETGRTRQDLIKPFNESSTTNVLLDK